MTVELTTEAVNCLKFWQQHEMYGGGERSLSEVVLQQMSEWLCRDTHSASDKEIEAEFERIKGTADA